MSYQPQTLTSIQNRLQSGVATQLPGSDSRLQKSNLNVLTTVFAGSLKQLHAYAEYVSKQIHITTADDENLQQHSATWGIQKIAATYAEGVATFSGVDGSVVPAGTVLQRADGAEYLSTAEATVSSSTLNVPLRAIEAGVNGNAAAGVKISFVSPVAGVDASGVVDASGLSNGVDEESTASLRSRLLDRVQQPPHGGNQHDYVTWAKEISGVTRAWVFPQNRGLGTVDLAFVMDDKTDTPIPTAAEVAEVQAHIDVQRPVTADSLVFAPLTKALDLDIRLTPDTAEIRTAVEAEIKDFLSRESEPGVTLYVSRIREAISLAGGEFSHDLLSPTAEITHTATEMPVLGTITWEA